MARVLVTGAAGFLGGELLAALPDAGHQGVGIDNYDPFYPRSFKAAHVAGLPPGCGPVHELDLLATDALEALLREARIEAVVHLAAKAGIRPSLRDPQGYYRTNVLGTVSLLEAAARAGVDRLVFASSSSVYGERTEGPFRELDGDAGADRPVSPYAATKRCGELALRCHAAAGGRRVAILRLFTVYGPWQRPDLAIHRFARQILAGEEVTVHGDGSMQRDFTFVADTVRGLLAALAWTLDGAGGACEIVNLGSGRPTTVLETVRTLEASLGKRARLRFAPRPPGDVTLTHADCTRARTLLGQAPATPLAEGLERFARWLTHAREQPWYPG